MNVIDFGAVTSLIVDNIRDILARLDVDYVDSGNTITIECPIHISSRKSLTIYLDGETKKGNFVCWTNHCEENNNNVLVVIQHLLQRYKGIEVSISDTCKFLDASFDLSDYATVNISQDRKMFKIAAEIRKEPVPTYKIPAGLLKRQLVIPSTYFLKRDYSVEILEKFDVGTCFVKGLKCYGRVVVPVYSDNMKDCIGYVARSLNEECGLCGLFHMSGTQCPPDHLAGLYNKWINSPGLNTSNILYGLWYAKYKIWQRKKVVLVEGQGDVWRLHEAGILNSVGLMGSKLSPNQLWKLNRLGVKDVYLALDNDDTGRIVSKKIRSVLKRYFNVHTVEYEGKDVGMLDVDYVRRVFDKCL